MQAEPTSTAKDRLGWNFPLSCNYIYGTRVGVYPSAPRAAQYEASAYGSLSLLARSLSPSSPALIARTLVVTRPPRHLYR